MGERWMIDVIEPDYGSIIAGPPTDGMTQVVPAAALSRAEQERDAAREHVSGFQNFWERSGARQFAAAAVDLRASDDTELQAIGIDLKALHDWIEDWCRTASARVAPAGSGGCYVREFSSAVCARGTYGCRENHSGSVGQGDTDE